MKESGPGGTKQPPRGHHPPPTCSVRGNSSSSAQAGAGTAPSASSSKPSTSTKRHPGPTPRRDSTCTGHSERVTRPRHFPPPPPRPSRLRPAAHPPRRAPVTQHNARHRGATCRPRPGAAAGTARSRGRPRGRARPQRRSAGAAAPRAAVPLRSSRRGPGRAGCRGMEGEGAAPARPRRSCGGDSLCSASGRQCGGRGVSAGERRRPTARPRAPIIPPPQPHPAAPGPAAAPRAPQG